MRLAAHVAFIALLSSPALALDLVIKSSKHSDAMKMMGMEQPAKDATEVTWFAKDRMRVEEGERVTIVRADQKKMYILDTDAKTVSTIDLPIDMSKYLPPEYAPMIQQVMGQMKVTVTPTSETKKIKDWNAIKYTMTMAMPGGGGITRDIWATKDIEVDRAAYQDLSSAMMSVAIGGNSIASEYKKIDGFIVLTEGTQTVMGKSGKTREGVESIETKDAPEGWYDVPKGFKEIPFDPLADSPLGGGGAGSRPKSTPPVDKQ